MHTRHHLQQDKKDNKHFVFNYTFDHHYDEIIAEEYTLKVILPEGSTNIKVTHFNLHIQVHLPYEVDSIS